MRRMELQTQALHRKLKDQFQTIMIQNTNDDSFTDKLEGSRLFLKADFSLLPVNKLQRIQSKKNQQNLYEDYKLIRRPRRNSIDCLITGDIQRGPIIDSDGIIKPAQKRQIVQNMRNVDKL